MFATIRIREALNPGPGEHRSLWQEYKKRADTWLQQMHQPALRSNKKGRATTTEVILHNERPTPKPGPPNGVTTTFDGRCPKHARWIRQTRRLESLCRLLHVPTQGTTHLKHGWKLWKAIRQAPGLPEGFLSWGNDDDHSYPTLARATRLRDIMQEAYQGLDATVIRHRVRKGKQSRRDNPYKLFADLRRDRSDPVQTLLGRRTRPSPTQGTPSGQKRSLGPAKTPSKLSEKRGK